MITFSVVQTALVGGREGDLFNDLCVVDTDGRCFVDATLGSEKQLDRTHPIDRIDISYASVIDGIKATYQLDDGQKYAVPHGSATSSKKESIQFSANEILVGVFGHAGPSRNSVGNRIHQIGFVIYDKVAITTRVCGPFGGKKNHYEAGDAFYVSDVIAFGGFADRDTEIEMGLSGLTFMKNARE